MKEIHSQQVINKNWQNKFINLPSFIKIKLFTDGSRTNPGDDQRPKVDESLNIFLLEMLQTVSQSAGGAVDLNSVHHVGYYTLELLIKDRRSNSGAL